MADGLDLSEIVRRTIQANARFYKGWVDLSLEYFRGITEIFSGQPQSQPAPVAPDEGTGVLVMEGEEGETVGGAFLVTNDIGRSIPCQLVASEFADPAGSLVRPDLAFDPPAFELKPGEQRVIKAQVNISRELSPGVAYNGEFAIAGLTGFAVPVVLRRQHRMEDSAAQPEQPESPVRIPRPRRPAKPNGPSRRKRRRRKAGGGGSPSD